MNEIKDFDDFCESVSNICNCEIFVDRLIYKSFTFWSYGTITKEIRVVDDSYVEGGYILNETIADKRTYDQMLTFIKCIL